MTSAQAQSFATLITALAVVLTIVLAWAPKLARLLFRHRLDAIRDEGVDAILDGRLRQEPPVDAFLQAVDQGRKYARWLTLARNVAILSAPADLGVDDPIVMHSPNSSWELDGHERKIMHGLEQRIADAFRSYLIWGSPLGWALAPIALIASRTRPGGELAKAEDALPALARETMRAHASSYPKIAQWAAGSRHSYAER
jgi:hypothetical protein